MYRIILLVLLFQFLSCKDVEKNPTAVLGLDNPEILRTSNLDTTGLDSGNIIWSNRPSPEWVEGYPIGNGRLGAMVLGRIHEERISLNHDLLWRQFWKYQNRNTAEDFDEIRRLSASGEWDKMEDIVQKKIATSGQPIYVNPYVPAGDLYINFLHQDKPITDYKRVLNLDQGIVSVNYNMGDVQFTREMFSSWNHGVLVTHLAASKAGMLTGEVSLSRIMDPECLVSGYALQDRVVLEGQFEEGKRFVIVLKVIQRGGRMTVGRKRLDQSKETLPQKNFGLKYVFSDEEMFGKGGGASTFFDSSDEVMILLAITTDDEIEPNADLVATTNDKLNS
ncbi:MAG TPA: glycoside hydrolase family 95 protein, partial [Arenibacter sp.]|nr:glycoside hydrolase family 95 protein [Arenibacter sp.]